MGRWIGGEWEVSGGERRCGRGDIYYSRVVDDVGEQRAEGLHEVGRAEAMLVAGLGPWRGLREECGFGRACLCGGYTCPTLCVVGLARAEVSVIESVLHISALEHVEPVLLLFDGARCECVGLCENT